MSIKSQIENGIYQFAINTEIPFTRRDIIILFDGNFIDYSTLVNKSDYNKNLINKELDKYFYSKEHNILLKEGYIFNRKFHYKSKIYYKSKEKNILNKNLLKIDTY